MRTSFSQFEVMVDFMERNGDLNKPAVGPHGRLTNFRKWEELREVLNMDITGPSNTVEKWKKVWSDYKNNTKRKAAKIHRVACGTGGGPASKLVLSDLEQRILTIMGTQSATGLQSIVEVGLLPTSSSPSGVQLPSSPGPSTPFFEVNVEEDLNMPGVSSQSTPFPAVFFNNIVASPTSHHVQSPPQSQSGSQRRRYSPQLPQPRRRIQRRPQRRNNTAGTASEQFLSSDTEWRNLATEFVTENARLRERELQQQAQWQILFARCLDILERYVDDRTVSH